ncbi:DUF1822 family protein [Oculatella sp. LEGE 06141]|uniref:DUF1822 family protein n=1 Tax=Oculatella sp. LEGE 06141 TaxID=1828648 RepID=UPI0030D954E1
MFYSTPQTMQPFPSIPLTTPGYIWQAATRFANQQPTGNKERQTYKSILAVGSLSFYLQARRIPTDLFSSDCWNPVIRLCSEIADLRLRGRDPLECCVFSPSQQECTVPPEAWGDRIGYVAIQIDLVNRKVDLLGFAPRIESETLTLHQLQNPESLPRFLRRS